MTHLVINSDLLAVSIILITLYAIHLYFKIQHLRKITNAYRLQADYAREERDELEAKLEDLKIQSMTMQEAK